MKDVSYVLFYAHFGEIACTFLLTTILTQNDSSCLVKCKVSQLVASSVLFFVYSAILYQKSYVIEENAGDLLANEIVKY